MTAALTLGEGDVAVVRSILARHLPAGVQASVFGSRAKGTAKPWSDLDLALCGAEPLSLALLAELAEAFDESPLAMTVDLVDRAAVNEAFGRIIDESAIAFDWAPPHSRSC